MIDQPLTVILLGFATYRIARILSREAGPFNFFDRVRRDIVDMVDGAKLLESKFLPFAETLRDLIFCPYCIGVWIALFLSIFISDNLISYLANSFAIAGLQSFIQSVEDNL